MTTVKDIIKEYLEENEYDGLLSPDGECACFSNNLPEDCNMITSCYVSYRKQCTYPINLICEKTACLSTTKNEKCKLEVGYF